MRPDPAGRPGLLRRGAGLVVLLLAVGCGGAAGTSSPTTAEDAAADASAELSGTVTVLAAASLSEVYGELADRLEAEHPDLEVDLQFGGSATLARQVVSGAPADVLATANAETMQVAVDAGEVTGPFVFARNRLALVVPPGNPGRITGLADLARPELVVALCGPEVPCGAVSAALLRSAGVTAAPDTLEQDVKAVLTKVVLDEVDAGLVYRSDVVAAGPRVQEIGVPESDRAVTEDLVAVLRASRNPAAAAEFVERVLSPEGQAVLRDAGFELP